MRLIDDRSVTHWVSSGRWMVGPRHRVPGGKVQEIRPPKTNKKTAAGARKIGPPPIFFLKESSSPGEHFFLRKTKKNYHGTLSDYQIMLDFPNGEPIPRNLFFALLRVSGLRRKG